jgi:hypothetical protein
LLRSTPDASSQSNGTVGRGAKLAITGKTRSGKAEIVYHGKPVWVTAQYLAASKPRMPEPGSSSKPSSAKHPHATTQRSPAAQHIAADHPSHSQQAAAHQQKSSVPGKQLSHPPKSSPQKKEVRATSAKQAPPHHTAAISKKAPAVPAKDQSVAKAAAKSVWDDVAQCESSGDWNANTGNGFHGGLQFTQQTWSGFGGSGKPQQASRATQIAVAKRVKAKQGWNAWPACSRKLGLL